MALQKLLAQLPSAAAEGEGWVGLVGTARASFTWGARGGEIGMCLWGSPEGPWVGEPGGVEGCAGSVYTHESGYAETCQNFAFLRDCSERLTDCEV